MSLQKTVTPGFHSKFNFNPFGAAERGVLNKIKDSWYVTASGEPLKISSSNYNYFLIKPATQFGEKFNLDREIICLFSPYENFEPRSLDVFDNIFQKLPKSRIENLCVILIRVC